MIKLNKVKAIWNDQVLAESNDTIVIEGNYYFPREALNEEFFKESETHTICPWKGTASYFTIKVNDSENRDAAWYYPETKDAAKPIEGRVAFWRGVQVVN